MLRCCFVFISSCCEWKAASLLISFDCFYTSPPPFYSTGHVSLMSFFPPTPPSYFLVFTFHRTFLISKPFRFTPKGTLLSTLSPSPLPSSLSLISPCARSLTTATGEIILWVGSPAPCGSNPAMGIVNFDNLVMEAGMKACARANKHRPHYPVKRKLRKWRMEGGWASRPTINAVRDSYGEYLRFQ